MLPEKISQNIENSSGHWSNICDKPCDVTLGWIWQKNIAKCRRYKQNPSFIPIHNWADQHPDDTFHANQCIYSGIQIGLCS